MKGYSQKMLRAAALAIALILLLGVPGRLSIADNADTQQTRDASGAYYLVGSMNEWTVNETYRLTQNTGAEGTEYMITLDLAAGAEFKVVSSSDGVAKETWYPDNADNYKITEAGNYTIYFRPNYDGGEDWYCNTLYAQ